jgi:hypothetical protein
MDLHFSDHIRTLKCHTSPTISCSWWGPSTSGSQTEAKIGWRLLPPVFFNFFVFFSADPRTCLLASLIPTSLKQSSGSPLVTKHHQQPASGFQPAHSFSLHKDDPSAIFLSLEIIFAICKFTGPTCRRAPVRPAMFRVSMPRKPAKLLRDQGHTFTQLVILGTVMVLKFS